MKLKWAIVGYGEIGVKFGKVLMKTDSLIAVYSRNGLGSNKQENLTKDVTVYTDYAEMLCEESIDIIYIASPNSAHFEAVKQALLAKKHVLCEKAIVGTKAEIRKLVTLATQQECIFAEAMTIFHMPLYQEINRQIESGVIGSIQNISAYFGTVKPFDMSNRFFNKELGGGVMLDVGTYALSFLQMFVTPAFKLEKKIITTEVSGIDSAVVSIVKSGDITGIINLSFKTYFPKLGVISGKDGYIEVNNYPQGQEAKIVLRTGKMRYINIPCASAFACEKEAMEAAVTTGNVQALHLQKSVQVIELIDDILTNKQG
ncbi:MAG: Gfo/Idh/MocA family protein [Culicoidibacterales bacterium]